MSIKEDMLNAHNEYRKKHGAIALKWNSELASGAEKWAEKCAAAGSLMHDNGDFGENVAAASGKDLSGRDAVDMWYDEVKEYDFSKPGRQPGTGHFTQVVWLGSVELGAGKAKSPNGAVFVVARYLPAGNNIRKISENVKPPGSAAPASNSSYDVKPETKATASKPICVVTPPETKASASKSSYDVKPPGTEAPASKSSHDVKLETRVTTSKSICVVNPPETKDSVSKSSYDVKPPGTEAPASKSSYAVKLETRVTTSKSISVVNPPETKDSASKSSHDVESPGTKAPSKKSRCVIL